MSEVKFIREDVLVLQTAIDDMNPEIYPYIIDKLFEAGVLDAYLEPVIMKKGRPGVILTALTKNNNQDMERAMAVIFSETTTLGIRVHTERRFYLYRGFITVSTQYGRVRVKTTFTVDEEHPARFVPEFEDCRSLAQQSGVPLQEIYKAATLAAEETCGKKSDK